MKELFARLEKVQAGARSTFTESRHAMKEFIERAEESIRRANELTYKRASGVAASERKRVGWSWRVEDKLFIQLLRKWLEEPGGSLCWMFEQLERIYNERDKIKLNAISAQLNALDPGENSKK